MSSTIDLALRRRVFAEDIQAICNLATPALVEALASVPREAFLRPGPWLVMGEGDIASGPRATPDGDARHLYHNYSIAIDAARQLFNGAPGVVAVAIDALALGPGARVMHVGAGLGYYTALIAHIVGATGRVLAFEADEGLAAQAQANLTPWPHVELRHDASAQPGGERFDGIVFNTGVTHPRDEWLDALAPGGRLVLPLTCAFDAPPRPPTASPTPTPARLPWASPTNIGKGPVVAIAKSEDGASFAARLVTMVAIYSAIGLRDAGINARLGEALKKNPFPRLARLRRDAHEPAPACWLHGDAFCLGMD